MYLKKVFFILSLSLLFMLPHFSIPEAAVTSTSYHPEDTKIPILVYHHFIEGTPVKGTEGAIISAELFKQQLLYLQEKGFHAISLTQLKDYLLEGAELPPNPFVITIDDGYESNYTLAYPILKELNMPANINIVVSSRGKKPGLFQHFSWDEAKEMVESGLIEIGSHTYDLHHEEIHMQPEESKAAYRERLYKDFKLSRDLIRKHLGIDPYIYCPPYGIYNTISQSVAKELGFTLHLSTESGVVTKESDLLALERIHVAGNDSPERLLEKINYFKSMPIEEEVKPKQETPTVEPIKELLNNGFKLPFVPTLPTITTPLQHLDALLKNISA